MGTVATLTSPYNVHLLTLVDVVPLIKTAGVVENSGQFVLLSCLLNQFFISFSVCLSLCIYIYEGET